MQVADERLPGNLYEVKKICYYAAVNRVLGGVYMKLCSGTTGLRQLAKDYPESGIRTYKVGQVPLRTPASNL